MRKWLVVVMSLTVAGCVRPVGRIIQDHPQGTPVAEPNPSAVTPVTGTTSEPPAQPTAVAQPESTAPNDPGPTTEELLKQLTDLLADVYFDYDRSQLRADAAATLRQNAQVLGRILEKAPRAELVIEGHCDERGSAEYNLALGDLRARRAQQFLEQLGLSDVRFRVISYGKEKPQCAESDEDCWRRNRRAHFAWGAP